MRCPVYAVVVLVSLTFPAAALAQTGPALLLKPLLSEEETWESRGDALFLSSAEAEGVDFDMSVVEVSGRFREQRERFIPRIGWDLAYYSLRSDTPTLDQDLLDTSVAVGLELGEYYNFRSGLTVGVGYAGNAPFGEGDAYYAKATLVLGKKLHRRTDLALVIDYDGNRTVFPDIPLPGIVYRHEFDPRLSYVIGVPLSSVTWRPSEQWLIELTWNLVDRIDARVEYKLFKEATIFANVERREEGFTVDGLADNDRLLFEQKRAEVGVRVQPWEHTSFLLAGGYAFGSDFSIGFDQRDSEKLADISDEYYFRAGFERRW
jgi:hypothetical protein